MVNQCANPECRRELHYLRDGKIYLFVLSTKTGSKRREHFWLCGPCSDHFTLRFDEEQGMLTVPLTREAPLRWLMPVNL